MLPDKKIAVKFICPQKEKKIIKTNIFQVVLPAKSA